MCWSLKELIAPEPVQKQPVVAWGRAGSGGEEGAKIPDLSGEDKRWLTLSRQPAAWCSPRWWWCTLRDTASRTATSSMSE
ncbi:hypothetical protein AV530_019823 [Patagioenas fasciata monilis]|uniref:Uncharacterized protein n=1 Tax=Patagioenas fasciata monilis TaxID=372326 RepID=A0A1V4JTH9_PATFA|nr:hypothetical protein AV530_019823 [Patagioenas fasciata monilis]